MACDVAAQPQTNLLDHASLYVKVFDSTSEDMLGFLECNVLDHASLYVKVFDSTSEDMLGFLECFTTTFLHTHPWLSWVDEDV